MKNQKGITLIALVVTIIVLLILAGISIAMLTGDNGIITRTNDSKMSQIEGQVKEEIKLAVQSAKIFSMQKSIETTGGGWFANEGVNDTNDKVAVDELTSVVNVMRSDLKRKDLGTTAAATGMTDTNAIRESGTGEKPFVLNGFSVSATEGAANSTISTINVIYTSPDYQAATNEPLAYIDASIKVELNDFSFTSINAHRAGNSSVAGSTLIDLNK